MEYKTLANFNGYIVDLCVGVLNGFVQNFEVTEDMKIVDRYTQGNDLVKPKWDFEKEEWIEGATQEEIQEWKEKNNPKPVQPNETDLLQKQLLETQNLVLELQEQILLNKQIK